MKLGILPLEIEVGRWKDVPLETRIWKVCSDALLCDEFHFLLFCEGLVNGRSALFQDLTENRGIRPKGSEVEIVRELLSKEAIKTFGRHLEIMYNRRKELLYQYDEEEELKDEAWENATAGLELLYEEGGDEWI